MSEDVLEISVGRYELARRLVTDSLYSWNIVGRVSHESQVIGYVLRRDTESLGSVFNSDPVFFDSGRTSSTWIQQPDTRPDQLLKVLVARHYNDIQFLIESIFHECSNYIVGFIAAK